MTPIAGVKMIPATPTNLGFGRGLVTALLLSSLLAGCGGDDAAVPTAGEAGGVSRSLSDLPSLPKAGAQSRRVTFLLPHNAAVQPLIWREAAQLDASKQNAVFTVRTASEGESMADLVRRVSQEGTSALVVVVDDPETLAPAIAETQERGIPIVTILEQVTTDRGPVPVVVRAEYDEAADELVSTVANDASKLGKSPEGPALVIYIEDFPEADHRAEALYQALERAGIEVIGDGPRAVSGGRYDVAEVITETLEAHPDLAMILTGDDSSFLAATIERSDQPRGSGMAVAGFVVDPENFDVVRGSFASAAAFADDRVLGIFAFRNALSLARGETVPDRIDTPMPVRHAPGPPEFGNLRVDLNPEGGPMGDFDPTEQLRKDMIGR